MTPSENKLTIADVVRIAAADGAKPGCAECAALVCPGWESLPGDGADAALEPIGALWTPDEPEPTLAEYHPAGTRFWSPDAPIALAFHPANRSEVWACRACRRAFLRYTEFGGYYVDRRIRQLDPALVVADVVPAD